MFYCEMYLNIYIYIMGIRQCACISKLVLILCISRYDLESKRLWLFCDLNKISKSNSGEHI